MSLRTPTGLPRSLPGWVATTHDLQLLAPKRAMDMGVDGLLVVCPYYSCPTQNGVYEHFKVIAEQTPLPQIVYSIAPRTGINIEPETLMRLAELTAIVGVKESSGDIEQISHILRNVPEEFLVLSGCDPLNSATLCLGGSGVVSSVANLISERVKSMVDAAIGNDMQKARQLQFQMQALVTGSSLESNPIPVKTALALMGELEEAFRLSLCAMEPGTRIQWISILKEQGLLEQSLMLAQA